MALHFSSLSLSLSLSLSPSLFLLFPLPSLSLAVGCRQAMTNCVQFGTCIFFCHYSITASNRNQAFGSYCTSALALWLFSVIYLMWSSTIQPPSFLRTATVSLYFTVGNVIRKLFGCVDDDKIATKLPLKSGFSIALSGLQHNQLFSNSILVYLFTYTNTALNKYSLLCILYVPPHSS